MTSSSRVLALSALLAAGSALTAPPAFAYLDPGTGSYAFQMVMAFVISAGFAIRTFWGRIRSVWRGQAGKRGGDERPPS